MQIKGTHLLFSKSIEMLQFIFDKNDLFHPKTSSHSVYQIKLCGVIQENAGHTENNKMKHIFFF